MNAPNPEELSTMPFRVLRFLFQVSYRSLVVGAVVFGLADSAPCQLKDGDFPYVATEDPLSPEAQQKKFHLPPGFEIQLVCAEPDVRKPINLNFDSKGRLYFTQSVEYPFPAKASAGRAEVRIIEGVDPHGRAPKGSTFVDGLNMPSGATPIPKG